MHSKSSLIRLKGELTIYQVAESCQRLGEALAVTESLDVVLADITELDTAGLQLLEHWSLRAQQQGKKLVYREPSAAVKHLVESYGLRALDDDRRLTKVNT